MKRYVLKTIIKQDSIIYHAFGQQIINIPAADVTVYLRDRDSVDNSLYLTATLSEAKIFTEQDNLETIKIPPMIYRDNNNHVSNLEPFKIVSYEEEALKKLL